MNSDRFVILSGCSGGGKSTLLTELARRGFATVEEPGRRIVREGLAGDGRDLPWIDARAFLTRAVSMALDDRARAAAHTGWVFFDRGLVDAASGLGALDGDDSLTRLGEAHRYHHTVFLTPPWPEIYVTDAERRHTLSDALQEYHRLLQDYPRIGYEVVILPRTDVASRADFIKLHLGSPLACRSVSGRQ
jgi:predicted ATPase